jgi:hypothetical protein
MPVPPNIAPEDSFVLDVDQDDDGVTIVVEAALRSEHPGFYWPSREGEANAYARLAIHLRGQVEWLDGQRPKVASDVTGEMDYGDLASPCRQVAHSVGRGTASDTLMTPLEHYSDHVSNKRGRDSWPVGDHERLPPTWTPFQTRSSLGTTLAGPCLT